MGYHRAGFEVVGVDIKPQPNYPFEFHQGDALTADLDGFDAIHASPPCQGYHNLGGNNRPRLIENTRILLESTGFPFVIENIPLARWALRNPILLCGSMFDPVFIDRHRLFESNWDLIPPEHGCRHHLKKPEFPVYEHGRTSLRRWPAVYGHGGGKSLGAGPIAMGIDWMTRRELVEALPPRFTEFIGGQLIELV